ncbi:MAG: RnfABCDGE type electron transport complex subunit G [Clostridia bacterium]|nr:RnfABCDGE type electron transport complex subunit G [Clostridia bacterium]
MKNTFKFLYPTLILATICLVVSLSLSSTNAITKKRIEKIESSKTQKAMSRVLDADDYIEDTIKEDGKNVNYFKAVNEKKVEGYIFITSSNGYGGEVKVMTAVLPDKTVKAVEILDVSNETPGLGQNATNEKFYGQFKGKSGGVTVVKTGADGKNNEINAITGATITSRAVTKAVNEALELCGKIKTEVSDNE